MRIRMIYSMVAAGLLAGSMLGARLQAQDSPLPPPSPIEKQLAARASDVTEVTLGKSMLAFADHERQRRGRCCHAAAD
jgi:hypothetical protein